MRWAKETALAIYREIATIPPAFDYKGHDLNQGQRDTLAKHAKDTGMHARLEALLKQARSHKDLAVTAEQLDSHSWLYNTPSGTLDLRTGHMTEHRREDLLTKIAPCAYQPEAQCANWQHFLRRVLPDPEVRAYVQRTVGYTLTGLTTEQCLFFLYGSGRSGKSTFLEILISLFRYGGICGKVSRRNHHGQAWKWRTQRCGSPMRCAVGICGRGRARSAA